MTAAWQNLEVVNTGVPPKTIDERDKEVSAPLVKPVANIVLAVTLYFDRVVLTENGRTQALPFIAGAIDNGRMNAVLDDWHRKYPTKKDVLLSTENRSPYKHLITLMDRLIAAGFPEVGITLN